MNFINPNDKANKCIQITFNILYSNTKSKRTIYDIKYNKNGKLKWIKNSVLR